MLEADPTNRLVLSIAGFVPAKKLLLKQGFVLEAQNFARRGLSPIPDNARKSPVSH
ncbi:MAG: hypothetical protein KF778_11700 [Rhodocyclaceae bacterium]|nr:hypothetical protein [Rhodocyclaceae bacterium]